MTTMYKIRSAAIAACLFTQALVPNMALAVDDTKATGAVDLTSARAKIQAGNFTAAVEELRGLAEDTQQVDIYNLLAFSLRKSGDFSTSLTYYNKALSLQPDYKPAREYLGELYLDTGDIAKAKDQLAELTKLCPTGCEELTDLQKAITAKSTQ